jgi:hypothetical protein
MMYTVKRNRICDGRDWGAHAHGDRGARSREREGDGSGRGATLEKSGSPVPTIIKFEFPGWMPTDPTDSVAWLSKGEDHVTLLGTVLAALMDLHKPPVAPPR